MRHALSLVQGDEFGSVAVPDPALKDRVAPATDTAHAPKISSLMISYTLRQTKCRFLAAVLAGQPICEANTFGID